MNLNIQGDTQICISVSVFIQTKLLTALFKNNIETKEYSKFVETQKLFLLKRKIFRIKQYAEKNMWIKYKKLA